MNLFYWTVSNESNKLETSATSAGMTALLPDNPVDEGFDSDEEDMLASYGNEDLTAIVVSRLESTLDKLYRLSFRIRSPATRIGLSKAQKFTDIDPETGVDLLEVYKIEDIKHVRDLLKQLSRGHGDAPDYLVFRLAKANTLRRKQFGYWNRRKLKQASVVTSTTRDDVLPSRLYLLNEAAPNRPGPSRPSTATKVHDMKLDLDDCRSTLSLSTLAPPEDNIGGSLVLPPPPKIEHNQKELECPLCYILCSRSICEKRAWE